MFADFGRNAGFDKQTDGNKEDNVFPLNVKNQARKDLTREPLKPLQKTQLNSIN